VCVEMTPHEYTTMEKHKENYRICVLTNCLNSRLRTLSIFAYNKKPKKWMDQDDRVLHIKEVQSARLFV
jgi:hypothetical protein